MVKMPDKQLKESDQMGQGTIVHVEEKHGPLRGAVPAMPMFFAVVLCILNFIVPGLGTILSGLTLFCCATSIHSNPCKGFFFNVFCALLQIITAPILVGWGWSIYWGILFIKESKKRSSRREESYKVEQKEEL